MALQATTLPFDKEIVFNDSLQVGDTIYYSITVNKVYDDSGNSTEITTGGNSVVKLGYLQNIDRNNSTLRVVYDDEILGTCVDCIRLPKMGDYIMFEKDIRVNSTSVSGYYAEVHLLNDNIEEKAELFSIGSEINESSK